MSARKLVFEVHFQREDGTEDCIVISGDSLKEIRQQAEVEVEVRNGKNPWSREVRPSR